MVIVPRSVDRGEGTIGRKELRGDELGEPGLVARADAAVGSGQGVATRNAGAFLAGRHHVVTGNRLVAGRRRQTRPVGRKTKVDAPILCGNAALGQRILDAARRGPHAAVRHGNACAVQPHRRAPVGAAPGGER